MTRRTTAALAAALAIGTVLSLTGCAATTPYPADQSTHCEVSDKTATSKSKGGTDYRVYTSCGVFSVADNFFQGQFNSADIYSAIQVGKTYDFEAYGWRNGFFSFFPSIAKATEVKP